MTFKQHLVFWALPTGILLALAAMYFSGHSTLMWLVAPEINRELGLLESFQHLLLLIMAILLARHAWRSGIPGERKLFALVAAGTTFVFLEELNYFTHYWWAINGWDWSTRPSVSVHNQGDLSDIFKDLGDIFLVVFFVIFPLAAAKVENVWVKYLRPSRMFILSLLAAVLTSELVHFLDDNHPPQNNYLLGAFGEFREFFIYWIWLLYSWNLIQEQQWPVQDEKHS